MKETTGIPEWTLIKEKRPQKPGTYLVTLADLCFENGYIYYGAVVQSLYINREGYDAEICNFGNIIAWIYLPGSDLHKWENKLNPYIPETLDVMYRRPRTKEDL